MIPTRLALASAALFSALALHADVVPAPLFTNHAVLQQGMSVPVWGAADPGEEVTVTFGEHIRTTRADADGRWRVNLPELAANATPAELRIEGKNRIVLRDILVGEVWLASGQSNMAWALGWGGVHNAKAEIAAADFPLIRELKIAQAVADSPQTTARGQWRACSPATASNFSAAGYFFARDIHRSRGVPVGIVNASVGGSLIDAWASASVLAASPAGQASLRRWQEALDAYPERKAAYDAELAAWEKAKADAAAEGREFKTRAPAAPVGPGHMHTRAGLFNGMIHPLAPAALRGALWYQGESNVGRHDEYRTLLPALIQDWRALFERPDLAFLVVQLPNYAGSNPTGNEWARLREAQAAALALPHTGMAVTIDIGDRDDIHPRNKQEVGRRFALLALAKNHGVSVEFSGPVFKRAERAGNGLRLHFDHAAGLTAPGGEAPGFELAGPDGRFVPAVARVERDGTVLVSASGVSAPSAVRYAWSNSPAVSLVNAAGLPAAPFRAGSH